MRSTVVTAAENVGKFLLRWQHLRPSYPTINTIQSAVDTEDRQDLTVADLSSVLDELDELREQLADRIVEVERTDTVVHLQNPPIDYGLPLNAVVRFATGPDEGDYVQVHTELDGEGFVHVVAYPGLEMRQMGGNALRVRPVRP